MSKSKKVSGGVEGMLDQIHERIEREANARGETWCHKWGHPSRKPGRVCSHCTHAVALYVSFWRSMGIRNEREMP